MPGRARQGAAAGGDGHAEWRPRGGAAVL